jgi:signal peptidase I
MSTVSHAPQAESPATPKKRQPPKREGYREMVESIVVAFVLAFLFRTFEAEAFVIPTGSMAPTLMGRHKDVRCPECGFDYRVSASEENEGSGDHVGWATCPNCRFTTAVDDQHSFKGDRILVLKFPYTLSSPKRFDVVVFKYPEDPKVNYIKRLVGLPGEEVRIDHGDLYVRPLGSDAPWTIVRKPPDKQRILAMPVYDNDRQSPLLREAGWPARWQAEADATWTALNEGKEFDVREPSDAYAWLRYQHLVPDAYQWQRIEQGAAFGPPRPQLITDCYGYNLGMDQGEDGLSKSDGLGNYWVGDLSLSFDVAVAQPGGELVGELVEGVRRYQVVFDLATGDATLRWRDVGDWQVLAASATELRGSGEFRVRFANVDDQLLLWVNDAVVPFGPPDDPGAKYEPPPDVGPVQADLQPAAIGARGAVVKVRRLILERDIYYGSGDVDISIPSDPKQYADVMADPQLWRERFRHREKVFRVEPATYFVLGDNNPRSKDGRLWHGTHTVKEHLMIGQAFFIYWPHGVPFSFSANVLGLFGGELYLPFLPQLNRMRLIR